MGYVVGLGLQNPELKILFQLDIRLLRCQSPGNQQLWQQLSFYFLYFCQSPVANMAANKIKNKSLWRDKMSYGSDTWYMGRIYDELKNYACVWLISNCIIN